MADKSNVLDLGLSEKAPVPGVKGSEQDRFGPNQLPKKQTEKVSKGGKSFTIK